MDFLESLVKSAPEGEKVAPVCKIKPLPTRREGILIPAQVAFAAAAYNLSLIGAEPSGSFDVVRSLAGYEYLWGAIRVRGGAYGAGMAAGISGNVGFYSYRDPTPKRTLSCFAEVADFLREFAEGGGDVSKYIIGAIGDSEPIRTPRMRANLATVRYLRGIDNARNQKTRESILSTDKDEILRIADLVEKCIENASVCVVGSKEKLDSLSDTLEVILQI
jgi:Zn-dependent M16 (insulinase) family peptidase